eukprot:gnl/Hemi2/21573_TR7185_c0_g2_i1.p1 gnl/Hemi2/21573_TR7185_c0_g2~~gnl/Hemi2/21573_TR7185_c0_g2_i1.p1  ORF type:complete len:352 (+),score=121.60 gnl/Hemi2/21573_TR7185_c0_g2_i1:74-1057(+)
MAGLLAATNLVPLVTPLQRTADGSVTIDRAALPGFKQHLLGLGVKAVWVLGATGEFNVLPNAVRLDAVQAFAEVLSPDVTVFANASGDSAAETVANLRALDAFNARQAAAGKGKIDCFYLCPMSYLQTEAELVRHLSQDLAVTSTPVVLYNNPNITQGRGIPPAVLANPAIKAKVIGVKDSSCNMETLKEFCKHTVVYSGNENGALESLTSGAIGLVAGCGNLVPWPQQMVHLYHGRRNASMSFDFACASCGSVCRCIDKAPLVELQRKISELAPVVTVKGKKLAAGFKFALAERGVISDVVAPLSPVLNEAEREQIRAVLRPRSAL